MERKPTKIPEAFLNLDVPPERLYQYGNSNLMTLGNRLAIVGAREATPYGLKFAHRFAHDLAVNGYVIISGFARGVDQAAHLGAVEAGGSTIAVLGCGISCDYPKQSAVLKRYLVRHQLVITEFAPNIAPRARHFPHRNRLISALSQGVLVVEGRIRSGTYSTVTHALAQGLPVFAVPGPIDSPMSEGPNTLIKSGAVPVTELHDILDYFSVFPNTTY